jgi:hypothetical protein
MKKQALRTVTLLSLFIVVAAVSARGQGLVADRAVMNIPFDFSAGETQLRAGSYFVTRTPTTISIRSHDGRQTIMLLPMRTLQSGRKLSASKLVFHRYGDSYFLAQAWMFAYNLGYELPRSRAEREAIAQNSDARQEFTVIARR